MFGWQREDGTRRYRTGYIEIGKKNGKSTLFAGIGLYLLVADGEAGAEVYSAACDRDQASIIFNESARMVAASPALANHIESVPSRKELRFPKTNSKMKALSADVPTKEGLNASAILFDELHRQKNRDLWDTLLYSGAARRQPLGLAITTAGYDRESICYEQRKYAEMVLEDGVHDWTFLPVIYGAGEKDDWTKVGAWRKANPSYGVTIKADGMRQACREAQETPAKENAFRRYRLSQWTEQKTRWLSLAKWDACGGAVRGDLSGRECFGGLDLGSTTDLCALSLVFPRAADSYDVLWEFWAPEDNARERSRIDRVPYVQWAKDGLLRLTPGNVADYGFIFRRVSDLAGKYHIREIAVDRWQSEHISQLLAGEGIEVVPFGQGFASMSAPTKELEKLVLGSRLRHGGNPVARWMAGNVSVKQDAAENLKPIKTNPKDRIDGIVATIMALGRAMVAEEEQPTRYTAERGLLVLD